MDKGLKATLVEALKPLEFRQLCGPWVHVLEGFMRMVPRNQVCSLPGLRVQQCCNVPFHTVPIKVCCS